MSRAELPHTISHHPNVQLQFHLPNANQAEQSQRQGPIVAGTALSGTLELHADPRGIEGLLLGAIEVEMLGIEGTIA